MIQKNYLEKIYSGFLGMNIGIRIGASVEPTIWSYDRIKSVYGDITNYVKDYINFAADDDVNGPVFFLRSLYDDAFDKELTPQDVAKAWLNYTREGAGMFWWGGYGISTEHTTYLNLKNGIQAPQSGSISQNGKTLAEQIGGQIFIDTWGLVIPNNPEKAAKYGEIAASVSHDGEGILGARFFCAAISKAFVCNNIFEIIECGLAQISEESAYAKVSRAVIDFHKKNPGDFRACMDMLINDWGYDKYPGICHIIPNAGVCILSMLYGNGDFNRTVEIATMCGWDTDCNAGNVGTVLGVMVGIDGIHPKYRSPINDGIVLSGISGYLNILDIPTYSKELALLGYRLANEKPPSDLVDSFKEDEIYFDFELKGSTHNIRISDPFLCKLSQSNEKAYKGTGSLKVLFDRFYQNQSCKIFYKPYYIREDFSDERYSPVFTPKVYSGQTVSMKVFLDQWEGSETIGISPYIRLSNEKIDIVQSYIKPECEKWSDITFTIPDTKGDLISEVGIILEGYSSVKFKSLGNIYIDEFRIYGKSNYSIDFAKQEINFGCVSPFSQNQGAWEIEDGSLHAMSCGYCEAYAGAYFSRDYSVKTTITPLFGNGHMISVRAQGSQRGYHIGFDKEGSLAIYLNNFGLTLLNSVNFDWKLNTTYEFKITAIGNTITVFVDNKELLTQQDEHFKYGMFGCCKFSSGRTTYGNFEIKEF